MSTKQEIIKQAYGEYWDKVCEYVDENGIVSMIVDNIFVTPSFKDLGFIREFVDESIISWYDSDKNTHFWQLKSLQGIEDNNGWIKIEGEEDLPKAEYGQYHVYSEKELFSIKPKNQGIEPFWINDPDKSKEWLENFSHYQLIKKPKPPIY